MKIARAIVEVVHGALTTTFENARSSYGERTGLLFTLVADDGTRGLGEASPLPGFSPDALDDVRAALQAIAPSELGELDVEEHGDTQVRARTERISAALPSARFALETALLDLLSRARGVPIWKLHPSVGAVRDVPVAALISTADAAEARAAAERAVARGIQTLKIKIGRPDRLRDELAIVRAIRAIVGPSVVLRADANRSIPTRALPSALDTLGAAGVTLVEEPAPVADLLALRASPVPIALDETLAEPNAAELIDALAALGMLGAVVLKPTLLGGVLRAHDLARLVRALGADAIASHALEGPIAFAATAALALSLHARGAGLAHGLDAHAGLDAWPIPARGITRRPRTHIPMLAPSAITPWSGPGLGITVGA